MSKLWYIFVIVFFFKQKTAYEMRISDWSSDVCSSDLLDGLNGDRQLRADAQLHSVLWPGRRGIIADSDRRLFVFLVASFVCLGLLYQRLNDRRLRSRDNRHERFLLSDRKSTRLNSSH